MTQLSFDDINKIDIVDFLASIGIHPKKNSGQNYWYLSPLPDRNEKTPSFKVNRKLNRWWDFGTGEGSTLIDFGIRYYNCTIRELNEKLTTPSSNVPRQYPMPDIAAEQTIQILHTYPIRSFYLLRYLWERHIPVEVAQQYCVEVQYTFGPKPYYAIGFRCDAGGYELRNKYHKYSTRSKGPTLISHNAKDLAIFEGFFDLLTFVSYINTPTADLPDLLVLNSLSFFDSSLPVMETYQHKHLFLDNDPTGDVFTQKALGKGSGFLDQRSLYKGYNDLNQWVCNFGKAIIPPLEFL
jgi:hypothetical protein